MKRIPGNLLNGSPKPLTDPQDEKKRLAPDAKRTWCDIVRVMSLLWLGFAGIVLLLACGASLFLMQFLNWEAAAGAILLSAQQMLYIALLLFALFPVAGPWMVGHRQAVSLGISRTQIFFCNLRIGFPYWIATAASSGGFWFASRHIGPATPRPDLFIVAWVALGLALLDFLLFALFNVYDKRSS